MAAIPAGFIVFLFFNFVTGYTIKLDDGNDKHIVWPSDYHFKGEKLNFETTLKENFEFWYSSEFNRSRLDTNDGAIQKYYYSDLDVSYQKFPVYTDEDQNQIECVQEDFPEEPDFLPDVSDLTFTGQTITLYDKVVDIWTSVEEYEEKTFRETTLYVYRNDHGIDLPVQRIVKTYDYNNGQLSSHIITNYFDFRDAVTEEEVTLEDMDQCELNYGSSHEFKDNIKFYNPDIDMELDMAFERYAHHHGKSYHEREHKLRKMIFEENWRMVNEHNRKNAGFKVELNEFSDRTKAELKYLTGTLVSQQPLREVQVFPHSLEEIDALVEDLPENFDLRMEGAVSPVKSQGHCGSCWAFCTTAAVEGALARKYGGRLLDLSEQSLVDCAWEYDNMGCEGGTLDGAMKYVLTHGVPTEMDYGLYTGYDGYCLIQNMTNLSKISGFGAVTPNNPNALKLAIYKYGPVTVSIHSSSLMKHYSSGVFYDFDCEDSHPNHGVTVVGYGVRDGEDYWLVKNSWGELWGEDGYILMSARNDNCFLLDNPYYPIDGYCLIQNMTNLSKISGFGAVTPNNPNALKLAIYKYGPVTVSIHSSSLMKHYSSGVFYDFDCEDSHPNHGVTVVGYGVRDGEDYWLVKNSWGELWGEDGYILMSARNDNCFLLDNPYYPIV